MSNLETPPSFAAYKIRVHYHTIETSEYEIIARSPEDAMAIAKWKFPKTFTEKCRFDKAEIIS